MSTLEWRGGFPVVFNGTVAATGVVTDARGNVGTAGQPIVIGAHQRQLEEDGRKGPITTKWMRIANHDGPNGIKIYFSQDHFDDDVHFATVDSSAPIWEGPAEVREVWLRATGGTPAFDISAFHRRG